MDSRYSIQPFCNNLTLSPVSTSTQESSEKGQTFSPTEESASLLQEQLGQIMTETIQAIVKDAHEREKHCLEPSKFHLLSGGIWSQSKYYNALKHWSTKNVSAFQNLEHFKKYNYFFHAYPPHNLFELIPSKKSPTGFEVKTIQLINGVEASKALDGIIEQKELALLDDLMISQLGQYRAIQKKIGNEKLNRIFSHQLHTPMRLGILVHECLMPFLNVAKGKKPAVGQCFSFKNFNKYHIKHSLLGDKAVICATILDSTPGKVKYISQDSPIEGSTKEEIEQFMVDEFNKPPMDTAAISVDLAEKIISKRAGGLEVRNLKDAILTSPTKKNQQAFFNFLTVLNFPRKQVKETINDLVEMANPITLNEAKKDPSFGMDEDYVVDFKIDLIQKLIEMPLEQVSMDFVRQFKSKL